MRHDRSQRRAHGESGVEGGTISLGTLRAARRGNLAADHHPGRGRPHLGRPRQELPGRVGRAVRGAGRARPRRTRRGCRQAGARHRVLPGMVVCHPAGGRTRRAHRRLRSRRPQPGLLHDRRWRGGRKRVEAGQAVLQADGQARQAQGDLAGHRIPRHAAGSPRDHGCARVEGAVRAAHTRRLPRTEHEHLPCARAAGYRSQGVRPLGRRSRRRGHRVRGPRHRRCRVPRACPELRWLLPAAARVLPDGCARSATSTTCCWSPTR